MPSGVYVRTEECNRIHGEAKKGKHLSEEHKKNISESGKGHKGCIHSEEMKTNMSKRMKGCTPWNKGKTGMQIPWNKGIPWSREIKEKLSKAKIGRTPSNCKPIGSEHIYLELGNLRVYIKTQEGWIARSRYVIEQILGRKLESWELVHHKDENTLNDNPDNLQVVNSAEHMRIHSTQRWMQRKTKWQM